MNKGYILSGVSTGLIGTNCYTVINENTKEAFLVDASGNADILLRSVNEMGARPVAILITHAHFDHMDGVREIKEVFPDAEIIIGEKDAPLLENPSLNLSMLFMGEPITLQAERTVTDDEVIELIGLKIRCIEVPGHTIGGMCYYIEKFGEDSEGATPILFDGDTLFCDSVGRSDFPTGDEETLLKSIEEKLFTLPENTMVYPGHNRSTTIEREKKHNIYF